MTFSAFLSSKSRETNLDFKLIETPIRLEEIAEGPASPNFELIMLLFNLDGLYTAMILP